MDPLTHTEKRNLVITIKRILFGVLQYLVTYYQTITVINRLVIN